MIVGQDREKAFLLKLTFCLRRLPRLTLAEFHDYWLNNHGPLVRRLQPALGMVRGAPEPYDGVAELWWESEQTFRAARRNPGAREAGRLLLEHEAKFIDLANSPLWLNREEPIHPDPAKLPA